MKRLFWIILMLCLFTNQAFAAGWVVGEPLGTRSVSDIDTYIGTNNTALDLMLAGYRQNAIIQYASAATLTVSTGELMVSNSGGTIRLMLRNTSATTVSWSDIDTGVEAISSTYYIYACASAITDTTFTIKISLSSSVPAGITYYKRLGSFYNDSSGNITLINNDDDDKEIGDASSKTDSVPYQATTDGQFIGILTGTNGTDSEGYIIGYSDTSSSPTTVKGADAVGRVSTYEGYILYGSFSFDVKKGDYYKGVKTGDGTAVYYFIPKQ